jgi:ADP-ribosylglycohydrolase
LLGAALGFEAIPKRWINGLTAHAELEEEIEQFIKRFG